jgi:16S rRNA (cytidine1402-2'-O)-methyltransferase
MLYIVSTPIGNLEDITLRAIRILKEVDLIAAEDTRKTGRLLSHYNIKKPMTSYFEHNEKQKAGKLIEQLLEGKNIALVSDAGTPCISDPGYCLVRAARENDIEITVIPGPSAVIAGLVLSNMPVNKFIFLGYLSPKKGKKEKQLEEVKDFTGSVILYESPYKIKKTLQSILNVMGDIEVALCREITKIYEEVIIKKVSEVIEFYEKNNIKGEFVLVFSPKK